jgi:DNA-directed RNA polymerase specialized sigma24 family protein
MEPTDHEMYRAAIDGDLVVFELVIRKMSRPLFAIAFGALQNRDEADDVVQDTFVKSVESALAGAQSREISALIATIVRNRAHDILMRRRTIPLEEQFNELPRTRRPRSQLVRNTDLWPVRQADILSAFLFAESNSAGRAELEVCVPLLVAGASCSKHLSIVK